VAKSAAVAAPPERKPLTGPTYREFVRGVVERKRARTYLEVGVHNGSMISQIDVPTIGVDPKFAFKYNPAGKKRVLHLYQMTSDEFFRDHDPRAILGAPVDVAFLDGLHLFEFLLRDFINAERVCDPAGVILLDDCLPMIVEMAEREHRPEGRQDHELAQWWTGDVWKVVTVLREYRPDLRITPVDVRPSGSILVSNLDPASTRLSEAYFEIVDRFAGLEFDAKSFDVYWEVNRPRPAAEVLDSLTLFARA
jgi:hypothetical protein